MPHGLCASSASTALTTDGPKMPPLSRTTNSQTYSAFLEEAQIMDSLTQLASGSGPPIRFTFHAPSKRFFTAAALAQLALLSSVVAMVLLIANTASLSAHARIGYVVWLAFSVCGTFVFALLSLVFLHQRRRLRYMQNRLKSMQLDAEAGDQKRLDDPTAAPQLRHETDHRHSVLVRFPNAEEELSTISSDDVGASGGGGGGRQRQPTNASSTVAGEGCELAIFHTHLSATDDAAVSPPPPTYAPPRRRASSATTPFWHDNPTMMDLYLELHHHHHPSSFLPSSSSSSEESQEQEEEAEHHHHRTPRIPPLPTHYPAANRSSTALPQHHQGAATTTLHAFPLPPTHTSFSSLDLRLRAEETGPVTARRDSGVDDDEDEDDEGEVAPTMGRRATWCVLRTEKVEPRAWRMRRASSEPMTMPEAVVRVV